MQPIKTSSLSHIALRSFTLILPQISAPFKVMQNSTDFICAIFYKLKFENEVKKMYWNTSFNDLSRFSNGICCYLIAYLASWWQWSSFIFLKSLHRANNFMTITVQTIKSIFHCAKPHCVLVRNNSKKGSAITVLVTSTPKTAFPIKSFYNTP